jgi:hypothetical protein
VNETAAQNLQKIRSQAIADGMQLFILVKPDACPVCAMHRGKIYWADEAPTLPLGGCLKHDCGCEYRVFDHRGPSLEQMLANGINAAKAGKREEAQDWLVALLQIDRYHEQAWLWLSGTADNDQDRLDCIEEVLKINPDNRHAQRGLAALQARGVGIEQKTSDQPEGLDQV